MAREGPASLESMHALRVNAADGASQAANLRLISGKSREQQLEWISEEPIVSDVNSCKDLVFLLKNLR
jgi:hypothetical protein